VAGKEAGTWRGQACGRLPLFPSAQLMLSGPDSEKKSSCIAEDSQKPRPLRAEQKESRQAKQQNFAHSTCKQVRTDKTSSLKNHPRKRCRLQYPPQILPAFLTTFSYYLFLPENKRNMECLTTKDV